MALTLTLAASQASDGSKVTISATGNFADNGYTEDQFVRQLVLTDYLGNILETYTLPPGTDTQDYPVPSGTNPWLNIDFTAVGPVTVEKILKYAATRNLELVYIDEIKGSCGCCPGKRIDMCAVDAYITGYGMAIPIADAVNYQDDINAAYALLTA